MSEDDDVLPGPFGARAADPGDPREGGEDLPAGSPAGSVYDWYRRGIALLSDGHPAAAAQLLARAAEASPESRHVSEAFARALYDTGDYAAAGAHFTRLAERDPVDDYAHFGAGMAAAKQGEYGDAVGHLAVAAALRPDNLRYRSALRGARHARSAAS
ncbi:MAG: hypothetical protein JWM48_2796 [Mycobacterium sp.]|nr:hypothetical protein [Mycobacterium sp.]MCW2746246.1 hypothetical protein [Mycobacterium sp.]